MKVNKENHSGLIEAGKRVEEIIKGLEAEIALLFVIKNGGVAAIIDGQSEAVDENLVQSLKLFRVRLDSMIEHVESGKVKLKEATPEDCQLFVLDTNTGKYQNAEGGSNG